jgi:farnesyl-diphosphate farnesyltransferase
MGLASQILNYAIQSLELSVYTFEWKLQHLRTHSRNTAHESATARICFSFLDLTSRSFSAVVQELHPELLLPVCIFYLILRGLDTIEDDTSIPLTTKEPLLRNFKDFLERDGWCFTGNRAEEKDRELLVQFAHVIVEYKKLKPEYKVVIRDITDKMGNGMADFAVKAARGEVGEKNKKKKEENNTIMGITTVEEYDLYCWYVAGVVGQGVTRLFISANLADADLLNNDELYTSMGLLLQKNNIIRDVCADHVDGRHFWPQEIWSKHVSRFSDLFDPAHVDDALNCSSEMVLNALCHARDCLTYLAGLQEQSVFNFCAIPQSMAMATLDLCFRNPDVFAGNVKIARVEALRLMVESRRDVKSVREVFARYACRIRQRNDARDPNFENIRLVCEEIEALAVGFKVRLVITIVRLLLIAAFAWISMTGFAWLAPGLFRD